MQYEIFSYRYGQQILEHTNFRAAWNEITGIVSGAPLFIYPGKSVKNKRLDVVQQLMNAYFDRVFVIEHGWSHHPLATKIKGSELKADYRKTFKGKDKSVLAIQVEVQFGNMARWYSDVFKFQAAYSEKMIQGALSIVPVQSLAARIDSNVVNFERAKRELPAAELSITLPIVMLGLKVDAKTTIVDVSKCGFASVKDITGKKKGSNLRRIVHAYLNGTAMSKVNDKSDPGPAFEVSDEDVATGEA